MSFNIRDYVSDDHIESIGEIARGQANIIQALSLDNSKLERTLEEYSEEIERLNNNWNELEQWCLSQKENDKYCYLASNIKDKCRYDIWGEVLDKLKELKGDDEE